MANRGSIEKMVIAANRTHIKKAGNCSLVKALLISTWECSNRSVVDDGGTSSGGLIPKSN